MQAGGNVLDGKMFAFAQLVRELEAFGFNGLANRQPGGFLEFALDERP